MKLIKQLTDEQFDELVIKSKNPVLILCTSPECIICKTMVERIKEASKDFRNKVSLLSLNINKSKYWQKYEVKTIPTLLYFRDGILLGHQSMFPEKKEIADKLKSLIVGKDDFVVEINKSIESEYLIARFYRYISNEAKNGKVRTVFSRLNKDSEYHRRLLEQQFQQLTGITHKLDVSKFESEDLRPQSFSLIGAIKTVIQTEEDAFKFYRLALKKASPQLRKIFKKLVKEETAHFKALKKQLHFLKTQETVSSIRKLDYHRWLGQLWR